MANVRIISMENNTYHASALKTILNYFAVFIVFSGTFVFTTSQFVEMRGFYFIMALISFFWLPKIRDLVFNRVFFIPFFIIIILSFYNVWRGFDTFDLLIKQVLGISINALWFYMLIRINDYDIKSLFRIYLNIAFVVALIGVIQEVSYLFKFQPGYDYKAFLPPNWIFYPTHNFLRVNSILPEPAGFCVSMLPAVFVALITFLTSQKKIIGKFKAGIIILSFILSFSSTGYIGLFIAIFLAIFRYKSLKRAALAVVLVLSVFLFLYNVSRDFKARIDDSLKVASAQKSLGDANLSVFALYSNARVAYSSFKIAPFIGTGLGSHELNYRKFISTITGSSNASGFVNMQDAASLFLRLISETGLLGIVLVLFFIFRFHLSTRQDDMGFLWIINNSALLVILIRLLRVGHYFTDGFFLFFWMYYFSNLQAKGLNREVV